MILELTVRTTTVAVAMLLEQCQAHLSGLRAVQLDATVAEAEVANDSLAEGLLQAFKVTQRIAVRLAARRADPGRPKDPAEDD
jgi:hypothetical protein